MVIGQLLMHSKNQDFNELTFIFVYYRIATLSAIYLTVAGIIKRLFEIDRTIDL